MDNKDETHSIISANDSAISLSEGSDILSNKNSLILIDNNNEFDESTLIIKKIKTSRRSSRISTTSTSSISTLSKVSIKNSESIDKINLINSSTTTTKISTNKDEEIINDDNLLILQFNENEKEKRHHRERKTKKPRKQYICHVCNKNFLGSSDLRKHLLIHSDERPFECEQCNKKFRQAVSLKNHIASIHGIGEKYPCDKCKRTFPIKERLRLHMRLHSGEKPYSCELCPKTFARGGQLRQHMVTHSGIKKYPCDNCSATFSTRSNLRLHLKNHNENIQYLCHICQKTFQRSDILQRHLDCYHSKIKKFHCEICRKTLKGHYHQHMRSHDNIKLFRCEICDAEFSQKCQLNVHFRMHSGERPYRCRVCWQAFAHSSVLKLHIRKHTGEKPFPCLLCKNDIISFSQLAHLKTHMRTIHNQIKPYMCIGCNEFFKLKLDLQFHSAECNKLIKLNDNNNDTKITINNNDNNIIEKNINELSKLRLLIAVVLKKISTDEHLLKLGFEKRLIDNVIISALKSAHRNYIDINNIEYNEYDKLKLNIEEFLKWTIPDNVYKKFHEENLSIIDILECIATFYSKNSN